MPIVLLIWLAAALMPKRASSASKRPVDPTPTAPQVDRAMAV